MDTVNMLYKLWYEEIENSLTMGDKLEILKEISSISLLDPFWLSLPDKKYKLGKINTEITGKQMYVLMSCLCEDLGLPVAMTKENINENK